MTKSNLYKVLFLFLALICIGLYVVAPLAIIKINIPFVPKFEGTKDFPPSSSSFYYTNNNDDTKLFTHYTPTEQDSVKGTIILVHGIRSNSNYYASNITKITSQGYNVVCPDLRAHGKSGGDYCTYGYYEKKDISALIDTIEQKYDQTAIGIWGQSLGGAISIQALAYDKRIKFGIIESTFSSLNLITHDYCKRMTGFDIPFITNFLLYRAGKIANFPTESLLPKNDCKKITQPIIFVHGNNDEHINLKYNRENFMNVPHQHKKFIVIDGATHLTVWNSKDHIKKTLQTLNSL